MIEHNHIRAHIRLTTLEEIDVFVRDLNTDGTSDRYTLENESGTLRINARSLHGMIYAASDYNDEMYFVNETNDGVFPATIDKYRV